ncbi:MAG: ABC transporter ATP-binding protein [Polyangiales bacterium]
MALLELKGLRRRYGPAGGGGRLALDGVDLTVERGESVAVLGTSGSGKSTLLHVMGGLDVGYEGEARLDGKELKSLSDDFLAALRQRTVGFVFQGFHLVPGWRVRQNVALPAMFSPDPVADLDAKVDALLERVGLGGRGDDDPSALSGGQRQRVAIARALLLEPPLLLCDEPTGSLDHATGESVLALFDALHRERGLTLVVVTHEARATALAKRVVRLEEGRVVEDAKKGDDA